MVWASPGQPCPNHQQLHFPAERCQSRRLHRVTSTSVWISPEKKTPTRLCSRGAAPLTAENFFVLLRQNSPGSTLCPLPLHAPSVGLSQQLLVCPDPGSPALGAVLHLCPPRGRAEWGSTSQPHWPHCGQCLQGTVGLLGHRSTLPARGQPPINCWSTIGQLLINCWSTTDQPLVNRWSTVGQTLVNHCSIGTPGTFSAEPPSSSSGAPQSPSASAQLGLSRWGGQSPGHPLVGWERGVGSQRNPLGARGRRGLVGTPRCTKEPALPSAPLRSGETQKSKSRRGPAG